MGNDPTLLSFSSSRCGPERTAKIEPRHNAALPCCFRARKLSITYVFNLSFPRCVNGYYHLKCLLYRVVFLSKINLLKIVFRHIQVCKQPQLLISLGGQGGREPGRIGRSGRGTGGRRGKSWRYTVGFLQGREV